MSEKVSAQGLAVDNVNDDLRQYVLGCSPVKFQEATMRTIKCFVCPPLSNISGARPAVDHDYSFLVLSKDVN